MFKHYLSLTKPGIIFGNLIAAAAGFFLAAKGNVDWIVFVATMVGVIAIVGSGCAFNNYVDRDIDGKMQRTKDRVLVKGLIPVTHALMFALTLGLIGFFLLYYFTNGYALAFGVAGFAIYVGVYTLVFKRTSIHATAIGSLSGACPPVIGYLAVAGQLDSGALILLLIFCLWQIPHSYAIAIYRFNDYQQANIPVLPLKDGISAARYHIIAYILAFIAVSLLLTQQNYTGLVYAVSLAILGLYWLYIAVVQYNNQSAQEWGKKLFMHSIITICLFSVLISLDFVPVLEVSLANT